MKIEDPALKVHVEHKINAKEKIGGQVSSCRTHTLRHKQGVKNSDDVRSYQIYKLVWLPGRFLG